MTCSGVGVLRPDAGGLCEGVLDADVIPVMSMVGEVREERGVSIVGGMILEVTGGDFDLLLPSEGMSSVAKEEKKHHTSEGISPPPPPPPPHLIFLPTSFPPLPLPTQKWATETYL